MKERSSSVVNVTRDDRIETGASSKGNQIKWRTRDGLWLKADDLGYEGLAEAVASQLLAHTNIKYYVQYTPCTVDEEGVNYRSCVAEDFLAAGESLITLYRLFETNGYSADATFERKSAPERLHWLVETVTRLTGLKNFARWLGKLLEFDAFILTIMFSEV